MSSPLFKSRPSYPSSDESDHAAVMQKHPDDTSIHGLRATERPLFKILKRVFLRWLLTVALSISIITVLKVYSTKPVLTKKDKRGFNTVMMALCIILGLAVISSLNDMVGDLRWWILSRRFRSKRKVELILEAERISRLLKLAYRSRRISVHVAAFLGLLVLLSTQIGVASLALCYSADSEDKLASFSPGRISIPDLTSVQTAMIVSSKSSSMSAQQYTANSYGTLSISYSTAGMAELPEPGTLWVTDDPLIFCDMDCRYIFHEIATDSILDTESNPVTAITSRSLETSAKCESWPVLSGGDGASNKITVADNRHTNIQIPIATGDEQTIFFTNISENCGPGCSKISAFEASTTSAWFYSCNSTVGQVINATCPEHQVTTNFTSMVSGAIALQGYQASTLTNNKDIQYQIYPAESIFGAPANGSVQHMAFLISRFTTGVVAATANNNNMVVISGMAPHLGSRLKVLHWDFVVLILSLLVSVQLILGLATTLLANRVVIPEHSLVEIAQVLRTMTNHYNTGASAAAHRQSAGEKVSRVLWVYRDTAVLEGVYDLHMEDNILAAKRNGQQA